MLKRERAAAFVLLAMYVPLIPLLFIQKGNQSLAWFVPVLPGWWLTLPAHGHKQLQYCMAGIGACFVLFGLSWVARRGQPQFYLAIVVAFLNSATISALIWFVVGLAGAGAFAVPG